MSLEIDITVKLGSPTPKAPPEELLKSLRTVEVTESSYGPTGFQLVFEAERYSSSESGDEYPLLSTDLLDPFTRVRVVLSLGLLSKKVLMDGYITHQEIEVKEGSGNRILVIGEDLSVKMDLFEISAQYKGKKDSAIATEILGKYSALGISASVTAPTGEPQPAADFVIQQQTTDRKFLDMLARRNGCQFYLDLGTSEGDVKAYWGPPPKKGEGTVQRTLTTNFGPANTVKELRLSQRALVATQTYGEVLDVTQDPMIVPVGVGSASPSLGLASNPAIDSSFTSLAQDPTTFQSKLATLSTRGSLLTHPTWGAAAAKFLAQSNTNNSARDVVRVEGTVDTSVYENILEVRQPVDLRGVGDRFDGRYLVGQVVHKLKFETDSRDYEQTFILHREGVGTTIQSVDEI